MRITRSSSKALTSGLIGGGDANAILLQTTSQVSGFCSGRHGPGIRVIIRMTARTDDIAELAIGLPGKIVGPVRILVAVPGIQSRLARLGNGLILSATGGCNLLLGGLHDIGELPRCFLHFPGSADFLLESRQQNVRCIYKARFDRLCLVLMRRNQIVGLIATFDLGEFQIKLRPAIDQPVLPVDRVLRIAVKERDVDIRQRRNGGTL